MGGALLVLIGAHYERKFGYVSVPFRSGRGALLVGLLTEATRLSRLNPLQIGEGSAPQPRASSIAGPAQVSIPFRSGRGALPCRQYLPHAQWFARANPTKFRSCCHGVVLGSKTASKNVRNPLSPDHLHKSDEVFGADWHHLSAFFQHRFSRSGAVFAKPVSTGGFRGAGSGPDAGGEDGARSLVSGTGGQDDADGVPPVGVIGTGLPSRGGVGRLKKPKTVSRR